MSLTNKQRKRLNKRLGDLTEEQIRQRQAKQEEMTFLCMQYFIIFLVFLCLDWIAPYIGMRTHESYGWEQYLAMVWSILGMFWCHRRMWNKGDGR